ncbi:hypothetical protein PIB30_085669 [Stylosanthes scabra]|uniref:Uncharacterized protein n=1 Tax=Stylosanthes scabra TaxID=79078 RepID=A0ABU6ZRG5_9FABA|nr:hypothetical protein [Stylosanthes scabra]
MGWSRLSHILAKPKRDRNVTRVSLVAWVTFRLERDVWRTCQASLVFEDVTFGPCQRHGPNVPYTCHGNLISLWKPQGCHVWAMSWPMTWSKHDLYSLGGL